MITPSNTPDFRDLRSSEDRVYADHHMRFETMQNPALVHPCKSLMFGSITLNGTVHPHITLYALCGDFGLCFVPSADELEAMGQAMIDRAAKMRAEADTQASAAIERARKGEG